MDPNGTVGRGSTTVHCLGRSLRGPGQDQRRPACPDGGGDDSHGLAVGQPYPFLAGDLIPSWLGTFVFVAAGAWSLVSLLLTTPTSLPGDNPILHRHNRWSLAYHTLMMLAMAWMYQSMQLGMSTVTAVSGGLGMKDMSGGQTTPGGTGMGRQRSGHDAALAAFPAWATGITMLCLALFAAALIYLLARLIRTLTDPLVGLHASPMPKRRWAKERQGAEDPGGWEGGRAPIVGGLAVAPMHAVSTLGRRYRVQAECADALMALVMIAGFAFTVCR